MRSRRSVQAGFSQRIRLEWMDLAARLVVEGAHREQIASELHHEISQHVSVGGSAQRGNREKIITIVLRTWCTPQPELVPLRDDALGLISQMPAEFHIVLHWGMAMAAYPFFTRVADAVGRQIRLQGRVVAAQVQHRMREHLGERETVARAARRVLRTFANWAVLQDTPVHGVYDASAPLMIHDARLSLWLVEALLWADLTDARSVDKLVNAPALFPFSLSRPALADLNGSVRLEWFRQGVDDDLVRLHSARR